MSPTKRCPRCQLDKPLSEFNRKRASADGFQRLCRTCDHAANLAWRTSNPERHAENHQKWIVENREKHSTLVNGWRRANPDRTAAIGKRSRIANADKYRVYRHRRRALERAAEGDFTQQDIDKLLAQQQGLCVYCRCDIFATYEVDHIVPLSRGGSNWPHNLQLLCRHCNAAKGDNTHEEYIA